LRAQANYISTHASAHIRLEGNTDSRGSREYNVALGWRRAVAVSKLLEQYGVLSKQMTVISYGEEKPVAFGHTAKDYALNRRVDLIYKAT